MSKCAVCKRPLAPNARKETCPRCMAVRRYWLRPEKGVVAIIERAKTLKMWEDRMLWLSQQEAGFGGVKRAFKRLRSLDHGGH